MLVLAGKPTETFKHMLADGLETTTRCYHLSACKLEPSQSLGCPSFTLRACPVKSEKALR